MPDNNVYEDVRDALQSFAEFLGNDQIFGAIQTVVGALKPHVPAIGQLLTQLIGLIEELEAKMAEVNVNGAINQVPLFAEQITGVLTSATAILGEGAAGTLQDVVEEVAQYAGLITQIIGFIGTIKTRLNTLNA